MTLIMRLLDLVYPPECAACRQPIDAGRGLCAACFRDTRFITGPVCAQCGVPLPTAGSETDARCESCTSHPPAWDRGRAAVMYEGAAREVILKLKHADRLDLAPVVAGWLARAGAPLIADAEVIAVVPLHWTRLLARRSNQSAEIARSRALGGGAKVVPDLLRRTRATPQLKGAGRDQRHELLAGAIALTASGRRRVAGRRVLLIDDVMTTGATLSACAEVCRDGGATAVDVLAVARVARENFLPI